MQQRTPDQRQPQSPVRAAITPDVSPALPHPAEALSQLEQSARPPIAAIHSLHQTLGNAAVQRLLIQRDDASIYDPPDKTGYLGFNPGASREAAVLKGRLKENVIVALNDPKTEADLQTEEGIAKWILEALGIDVLEEADRFMQIFDCLKAVDPKARDMVAQAMKMFQAAERGDYNLERLVLSGHSDGVGLWGDDSATQNSGQIILDQDLVALAKIFPGAAAQVEDIMFSSCFSANSITLVVDVFPNLKNAWGYLGYSPSAEFDAPQHIAQFESSTSGDQTLKKEDGRGAAALWTRDAAKAGGTGFIRNDVSSKKISEIREVYDAGHEDYLKQFEGIAPIDDMMHTHYSAIQYMLMHPELGEDERPTLEAERGIVLRMRYYSRISQRFASEYKPQIDAAYQAVGRPVPNFASLSRAKLKEEMTGFKAALEAKADTTAQQFYDTHLTGLWTLTDGTVIPSSWI